jgi:hypothetical protein
LQNVRWFHARCCDDMISVAARVASGQGRSGMARR